MLTIKESHYLAVSALQVAAQQTQLQPRIQNPMLNNNGSLSNDTMELADIYHQWLLDAVAEEDTSDE